MLKPTELDQSRVSVRSSGWLILGFSIHQIILPATKLILYDIALGYLSSILTFKGFESKMVRESRSYQYISCWIFFRNSFGHCITYGHIIDRHSLTVKELWCINFCPKLVQIALIIYAIIIYKCLSVHDVFKPSGLSSDLTSSTVVQMFVQTMNSRACLIIEVWLVSDFKTNQDIPANATTSDE